MLVQLWRHLVRRKQCFCLLLCAFVGLSYAQTASLVHPNPYDLNWHCVIHHGAWACRVHRMPGSVLYQKTATATQKKRALIKALGWKSEPTDVAACPLCGGRYYFPKTPENATTLAAAATKIVSGLPQYQVGGRLNLSHGVVVSQPGRRLYAEGATLFPNAKTGKLNAVHAQGNVRLRQPGLLVLGQKLNADLISHRATLNNVHYLARVEDMGEGLPLFDFGSNVLYTPPINGQFTGFARGKASTVRQVSQSKYILHNATYTTCPPTGDAWQLAASKITLNQKTQVGHAKNVVLKFYHVPIFYAPYFSFPLNDRRKTGLLYPLLNFSTNFGYYAGEPIYLNLAPNYDDTVTPQYYTKRGFMLGNQFRLLTQYGGFVTNLQWVPRDQQNKRSRYGFFFHGHAQLPWGFKLTGLYDQVSDQNYLRDFSNQSFGDISSPNSTSSPFGQSSAMVSNTAIIPRKLKLSRSFAHWALNAEVSSYKVVGQLALANQPYNLLPSVTLTGEYPNLLSPLSLSLKTNYTNFQKTSAVSGQRTYIVPTIGLSFQKIYGFIKPQFSLNAVNYNLSGNVLQNGKTDNHITRVLPTFDLNTGLYFDRHFRFLGQQYSQTLEPQLFYLYVPYQNQANIPIFDTSLNTLTFSQLFADNRFSGEDRIQNANQLSAAVSTTVNNAQGVPVLSANVGQILYFQNRKVSLCRTKDCIATEQPNYKDLFSPLITQLTYYFNRAWLLQSDINYQFKDHTFESQAYNLQYMPNAAHIFNIGYESNRLDYGLLTNEQMIEGTPPPRVEKLTGSFLWGLTPSWHVVGGINYSLNSKKVLSEFGGLEYDSCCWKAIVIADNYLTASNPNDPTELNGPRTTGILFKFELKGLGSQTVGSNGSGQIEALLDTIPGYSPEGSEFH